MLSANGVCYELPESPYKVVLGDFDFRFSTRRHAEKFQEKLEGHLSWLLDSMSRRFHVRLACAELAYVHLYRQVERMGFAVYIGERLYRKPEDIPFTCEVEAYGKR